MLVSRNNRVLDLGETGPGNTNSHLSSFGEILQEQRRVAQLTQFELAELAGVSTRTISDFERDLGHRPRKVTLRLLADALQLTDADRIRFERAAGRVGVTVEDHRARIAPANTQVSNPGHVRQTVGCWRRAARSSSRRSRNARRSPPGS